jgi:hypothetical protein
MSEPQTTLVELAGILDDAGKYSPIPRNGESADDYEKRALSKITLKDGKLLTLAVLRTNAPVFYEHSVKPGLAVTGDSESSESSSSTTQGMEPTPDVKDSISVKPPPVELKHSPQQKSEPSGSSGTGAAAPLKVDAEKVDFKMSTSVPSIFEVVRNSYDDQIMYMRVKDSHKISEVPLDPVSYALMLHEFCLKLVDYYSVTPYGLKKLGVQMGTVFGRLDPAAVGIDVQDLGKSETNSGLLRYKGLIDQLTEVNPELGTSLNSGMRRRYAILEDPLFQVSKLYTNWIFSLIESVSEFSEYMSALYGPRYRVQRLDTTNEIYRTKLFLVAPRFPGFFNRFASMNYGLWSSALNIYRDFINRAVEIPTNSSESQVQNQVTNALKLSPLTADENSSIPNSLSASRAVKLYQSLLLSMIAGRMYFTSFSINSTRFTTVNALTCVLVRFIDVTLLDPDFIRTVDNYIFYVILQAREFRNRVLNINVFDSVMSEALNEVNILDSKTNYLELLSQRSGWQSNTLATNVRRFLGPYFESQAGIDATVWQVPAVVKKYSGLPAGIMRRTPYKESGYSYRKVVDFSLFRTAISTINPRNISGNSTVAFTRVLGMIEPSNMVLFCRYFNDVARIISLSPLSSPILTYAEWQELYTNGFSMQRPAAYNALVNVGVPPPQSDPSYASSSSDVSASLAPQATMLALPEYDHFMGPDIFSLMLMVDHEMVKAQITGTMINYSNRVNTYFHEAVLRYYMLSERITPELKRRHDARFKAANIVAEAFKVPGYPELSRIATVGTGPAILAGQFFLPSVDEVGMAQDWRYRAYHAVRNYVLENLNLFGVASTWYYKATGLKNIVPADALQSNIIDTDADFEVYDYSEFEQINSSLESAQKFVNDASNGIMFDFPVKFSTSHVEKIGDALEPQSDYQIDTKSPISKGSPAFNIRICPNGINADRDVTNYPRIRINTSGISELDYVQVTEVASFIRTLEAPRVPLEVSTVDQVLEMVVKQ